MKEVGFGFVYLRAVLFQKCFLFFEVFVRSETPADCYLCVFWTHADLRYIPRAGIIVTSKHVLIYFGRTRIYAIFHVRGLSSCQSMF